MWRGGAHLSISFWYLWINLEKPEKLEFWKIENKNCWGYHHFTHVYNSWDTRLDRIFLSFWAIFCPLTWSYDVCLFRYGVQRTYFFFHFRPIFALLPHYWCQKLKLGKNVKNTRRYYPFAYAYHKSRSYDVCFLRYKVQRTEFFVILGHFCPLILLTTQKLKILEK